MTPAPVIQVNGSVVVLEQMGVNRLRAVEDFPYQRPSQPPAERTGRGIRYGDFKLCMSLEAKTK